MAQKNWPPLITATELSNVMGKPFPAHAVDAAADNVRRLAGWHISPEITETVILDSDGSGVLFLPSLFVTDVTAVSDLTATPSPRPITGYRWSEAGMLEGSFPQGFRSVSVTFTHGYDPIPGGLVKIIADRTHRRVIQEAIGGRSAVYDSTDDSGLESYSLGPRA